MKAAATLATLALAYAPPEAPASVVAVADTASGAQVLLLDERDPGVCPGQSLRAEYRRGPQAVRGCWVLHRQSMVSIVWLDGDADLLPLHVFSPPPPAT